MSSYEILLPTGYSRQLISISDIREQEEYLFTFLDLPHAFGDRSSFSDEYHSHVSEDADRPG